MLVETLIATTFFFCFVITMCCDNWVALRFRDHDVFLDHDEFMLFGDHDFVFAEYDFVFGDR
jgi:hypothetical protein